MVQPARSKHLHLTMPLAEASVFEVQGVPPNPIFWPDPRKIDVNDDMGTWFKQYPGLPTQTAACACYQCKGNLADSDYHILDNTYLPPLDYPALDWEARLHFADRLNRDPDLQNESPEIAQYFQDTYNDSYSQLNRVHQGYQNAWQPDDSLYTTVITLRADLQTKIDQRFALNDLLSEDPGLNASLHAQMASLDIDIENSSNSLSDAISDLNDLVNLNINTLLSDLGNISCQEPYEQDMKTVIETILQGTFYGRSANDGTDHCHV